MPAARNGKAMGKQAFAPSALGGAPESEQEASGALKVGGSGVKTSSVNRCPHCMAPLKTGGSSVACSNCGRVL